MGNTTSAGPPPPGTLLSGIFPSVILDFVNRAAGVGK